MDELVRWLGVQLDEDERIARAADTSPEMVTGIPRSYAAAPVALHIAEFAGPARVLREIDAKRQLIRRVFIYEAKIDGEWGCCHDADEIAAGLCPETQPTDIPALLLLALPYADRPDYRAEWAPTE